LPRAAAPIAASAARSNESSLAHLSAGARRRANATGNRFRPPRGDYSHCRSPCAHRRIEARQSTLPRLAIPFVDSAMNYRSLHLADVIRRAPRAPMGIAAIGWTGGMSIDQAVLHVLK
jgi:hypothetical protein